jgi:hypothetical protein
MVVERGKVDLRKGAAVGEDRLAEQLVPAGHDGAARLISAATLRGRV